MFSSLRFLTSRGAAACALICAMMCIGCRSEGPIPGKTVTGAGVVSESEHQFVVLDKALAKRLSFENPVRQRVENDRLQIAVDIRNRTTFNQSVDVSTVFRDEADAAIGDETAWTRLIFGPNQTQTYRVTSLSAKAAKFTVRVREGM